MFIIKTDIFQIFHKNDALRELYTELTREYSCEKAGSRLTEKYDGGFDEERGDPKESLNDAEQSLVDFIRDSSYSNIKPYLKRVGIYIAFLCLAVIFIIFWISYCSCCCCNCCLFSNIDRAPKTMQTILYIIGVASNLLVIIFSIIVLCLIGPFFSRLNGLFCSTLILLDHLNYGLSPQYPPYSNVWLGLGGVSQKFSESGYQIDSIDNKRLEELYTQTLKICNETGDTCICNATEIETAFTYYNYMYYSFQILNLVKYGTHFLDSKKIIDESRIDTENDIYDFLHDYANSHIKRACLAIFIITLILGVLGIAFLSLYYFMKQEIYRTIYIIIWNISMLISILAIIVSAIYGVIGYVFIDSIQVINYTLSSDNILNDDPIIFSTKLQFLSDIIEECANGDGHLFDIITEELVEMDEEMQDDFQQGMEEIYEKSCNDTVRDTMINLYQAMYNNTGILITSTATIFNISCAFAKNDKNIILNEIESAGNRAVVISTFQFLIGVLLAISVLAGILLVHKYNYGINKLNETNVTISQGPNENPNNSSKSFDYMNNANN
jgi:hypothetical protein